MLGWSIGREQLEQGLKQMVETQLVTHVDATFGAPVAALGGSNATTRVLSYGLSWGVRLRLRPVQIVPEGAPGAAGEAAAGIFLSLLLAYVIANVPKPLGYPDGGHVGLGQGSAAAAGSGRTKQSGT